jgi:Peptidase family M1 domain
MTVVDSNKGGIWYSSRLLSELERGQGAKILPVADAQHYVIDSTINGAEMSGTATMTFVPNFDLRVLPIDIAAKLRLEEAAFSPASDAPVWTDAAIVQEHADDDSDAAVIFPAPLKKGQKYLLRTTYEGKDVLYNAGEGNFTVMRRTSWYPNVGTFSDMATYELKFRTPEKFQVVGVGTETENRVEGKQRIATWKTPNPVRVAGFNYGRFKKLQETDKDSGLTFEVYTNPGTPDIIHEINAILSGESGMPSLEHAALGPVVKIDTSSLAKAALADGINTVRTGNHFFGPLADKRVAITQQSQWFSGQSWPTLIYMPYLAFLNGTQRNTLGLNSVKDFVDNVGPHEVAHQWWGHQVGARSYHDVWLEEGFSEFTAAMVAQQTGGWGRYNNFWENARKNILERPTGAFITNDAAGPISQGWRISSWQNRDAYGAIVYSKGGYVLHMLRMAMWDRNKGDEAFIAMMKEYASTYAGKEATTENFQAIAEKHVPQSMRLTKDNRLDWFFGQWVYGTAIPRYQSKFDVADLGGGKYKVTGSITQSEVPDNFAVVMPVYVHFDKTSFVKLGSVVLVGNQTKPVEVEVPLAQKPQKFSINAMHDVLAR